jgi:hypothetical protein
LDIIIIIANYFIFIMRREYQKIVKEEETTLDASPILTQRRVVMNGNKNSNMKKEIK